MQSPGENSCGSGLDCAANNASGGRTGEELLAGDRYRMVCSDALDFLRQVQTDSIDSVVTDPPAAISINGCAWDDDKGGRAAWVAWLTGILEEALRVLKPGGHMLIWAYPPKSHWTAWAVEDARFDFVQKLIHVFATGKNPGFVVSASDFPEFAGFSTTVRPSFEEWLLVRKPREGTVVENLKQWGVGALNVPACRVEGGPGQPPRFPGTLIHDGSDEVLALFPEAPGQLAKLRGDGADMNNHVYGKMKHGLVAKPPRVDSSTSASRFFLQYCAKASKKDQIEGLSNAKNSHPTVKPTMLMRIFSRLVTPPGGIVLDPFSGSGSTGKAAMLEGLRFLGCDQSAEYVAIANARISHALASTESQQIAKPLDNG